MKRQAKHVVLLSGGSSREAEASKSSAVNVHESLIRLGYSVTMIDPDEDLVERLKALRPDVVFNCLHGTFGEDGVLTGILEYLRIPYTHSGVSTSAIAMNKILTKEFAIHLKVRTPKFLVMNAEALFDDLESGNDPMRRPYVIKAINQGSTIGVFLVINEHSELPSRSGWTFGDQVLVEEYIPGKELSVAVFDGRPLGVIELRPKGNFYDYNAKYVSGQTEHIYPAEVPSEIYKEAMDFAAKLHKKLGCRTISRSDMRYNCNAKNSSGLFFLEVNTHPGFTSLSIFPEIAGHNGVSFDEVVEKLIQDAKCEIVI